MSTTSRAWRESPPRSSERSGSQTGRTRARTRPRPSDADAEPPAETALEALARAQGHARAAAGEATRCLGALLDAAALSTSGAPAAASPGLARIALLVDAAASRLAEGAGDGGLGQALSEALDAEILRWEARATGDPEARAVYRAFLGVRELLWEFGVRRRAGANDLR